VWILGYVIVKVDKKNDGDFLLSLIKSIGTGMRKGLRCFYMWSLLLQKMLSKEARQQMTVFS